MDIVTSVGAGGPERVVSREWADNRGRASDVTGEGSSGRDAREDGALDDFRHGLSDWIG